jgi:predicted MFS family arabinose efflux permease
LGGIVFGLLEWPPLGATHPLVLTALTIGALSLVWLPVVEHRSPNPMMPLGLFRSRTFTLANLLTLLLYAALAVVLFLVPMDLIQVQQYSATEAGAALLPFPVIMFAMSRWSGGLVARIGSRLPLTVGPAVAALGIALYARPGIGGSYWATFFPGVLVLALGMAITVAPLTTTAMEAVETRHAGVASGVNNAVARVAGLVAIAIFGVVLVRTFTARVTPSLDSVVLSASTRAAVDSELPRMAGADVGRVPREQATIVRLIINEAFVSAFRFVTICAAVLALAASVAGAGIR